MRAPLDSDEMSEFREFIEPINALAERQPGFVWRFTDDGGANATTAATPFADDMVIVNASVWTGVDELRAFVYDTAHSYFVRKRTRWFERMRWPNVVLWWLPTGERPTLTEAKIRLDRLEAEGPTPAAFTLGAPFPAPGSDERP